MTAAHRERAREIDAHVWVHGQTGLTDLIAAALVEAEEMGRKKGIEEVGLAVKKLPEHWTWAETEVFEEVERIVSALAGEGK